MALGLSPLPHSLMTFTSSCLMRSKYLAPSTNQVLIYHSDRWVWKKWGGPKQLEDKKTKSLMMLPYVPSNIPRQHWLKTFLEPTTFLPRTRVSRSTQRLMLMTLTCSSKSGSLVYEHIQVLIHFQLLCCFLQAPRARCPHPAVCFLGALGYADC